MVPNPPQPMPLESKILILQEETFTILGAAMEVLNTLGHGLYEKPYENALVVECRLRGIPCDQQPRFPVDYKTCRVGEFVPDLILHGKVVVETKTIDQGKWWSVDALKATKETVYPQHLAELLTMALQLRHPQNS